MERTVIANAKHNLNGTEILNFGKNSLIQKVISNVKKPTGAKSVNKLLRDVVWMNSFLLTNEGKRFLLYYS